MERTGERVENKESEMKKIKASELPLYR